ncbi:MAG: alpha-L-glutamate ligase-like protein [bacterium]
MNLQNISAWPKCFRNLRQKGILGLNRRNVDYLLPRNSRTYYPRVDNKLATKRICVEQGIRVPETYAVIEDQGGVCTLAERLRHHPRFVVKPATGSGGRGIWVIDGHNSQDSETSQNGFIPLEDLRYHILTILSGLYSLDGQRDQAIIEQQILVHPVFERFALTGLPDIRIIIYRGVPAMAMVRLPTQASGGRANLHQGAIGLGVDLATGETFGGVRGNEAVSVHPDTNEPLTPVRIPYWRDLLNGAIKLGKGLELGLIGVDYAIDAHAGPVVLEANARPGLAIQIANGCGLVPRFAFIDARQPEGLAARQRVELGRGVGQIA